MRVRFRSFDAPYYCIRDCQDYTTNPTPVILKILMLHLKDFAPSDGEHQRMWPADRHHLLGVNGGDVPEHERREEIEVLGDPEVEVLAALEGRRATDAAVEVTTDPLPDCIARARDGCWQSG
jgi:hypothetical protein